MIIILTRSLRIYDGEDKQRQLGELCEDASPADYQSTSGSILVWLHTNMLSHGFRTSLCEFRAIISNLM